MVKADLPAKCLACAERPLCAVHVGQLCEDCPPDSGEPIVEAARGHAVEAALGRAVEAAHAPTVEAVAMSAEVAQEDAEDCG